MGPSDAVILALLLSGAVLSMPGVQGVNSASFVHLEPRVIGGREIFNRCQAPYNSMVALQFESSTGPVTFCSAVMLSETVLVTSAFCVSQITSLSEIPITAIVGERDMMFTDSAEQRIGVGSFKMHSRYNATSFDNNIGLVQLSSPATLSSCVKPAFRMETDPTACNDMDRSCLIAGWGPYAETTLPTNSRLPRYASVAVYGDLVTSLLSRVERGADQPVGSLYAEAINPVNKACFFDWGGIVSCQRNGNYVLRGVIGEHNCNSDTTPPILVTNIPTYQSWIDSCLADWNSCPSL